MRPSLGAAVLGFLLALCAVLAWRIYVLTGTDAGFEPPPSTTTTSAPEHSAEYLTSWRRSQEADYFVVATVILENNSSSITSNETLAQYRGWRLINFDGTVVFEREGRSETCRQTLTEVFCTPPIEVMSDEEERAALEALIRGPDARYRVMRSVEEGCFDISLDASLGAPDDALGVNSTQCFDADSGALRRNDVERINRTERYEASEISSEVTASRLRGLFPEPILELFLNR